MPITSQRYRLGESNTERMEKETSQCGQVGHLSERETVTLWISESVCKDPSPWSEYLTSFVWNEQWLRRFRGSLWSSSASVRRFDHHLAVQLVGCLCGSVSCFRVSGHLRSLFEVRRLRSCHLSVQLYFGHRLVRTTIAHQIHPAVKPKQALEQVLVSMHVLCFVRYRLRVETSVDQIKSIAFT